MAPLPRRRPPLPLLVGLLTFAGLAATSPFLPIVWDEGYTLGRVQRARWWVSALADPPAFAKGWTPPALELVQPDGPPPPGRAPVIPPSRAQVDSRAGLLAAETILYFWPFAREEPHGHPSFYGLVGLLGNLLDPSGGVTLALTRLGTILSFSLANAFLFGFLDRRRGRWAALAACGALALQPRLFAHAHYATYDALLTSLWLGCLLSFWMAVEGPSEGDPPREAPRWAWAVVFGAILGAACATKLTGWMIPLPFIAWSGLFLNRRGFLTLAIAAPVSLLVAYALVPPWWHDPVDGFSRFLASNLGRAQSIPIRTLFLGTVYNTPADSLPWYNTLALTAFITPVGLLVLAVVGAGAVLHRAAVDRLGVLVVGNWAFLLLLRSLPNVPGHDGERLFLPAFGLLAVAAGLGAGWLVDRWPRFGKAAVSAALAEGLISILFFFPIPLAYWSPLIGGPRGAEKLGMEPTYYWDALTPAALAWLNEHTPPGDKVAFASQPTGLLYLNATGQLRPSFLPNAPGRFAWYVLQNRPGAMSRADRRLLANSRPAFTVGRFGVPLVWVYSFDDFLAASDFPRVSTGPTP